MVARNSRLQREDALAGNISPHERGVTMRVRPDDGSKDWAELYARTLRVPVHGSLA